MTAIPSFQADLTELSPRERRDRWHEIMPTHQLGGFEEDARGPAGITAWNLGDIALGHARVGAMQLRRTEGQIRRDQIDHYALSITAGGSWVGDAGGKPLAVAGPGVFLLDMARPIHVEAREMDATQLVIPRELLNTALGGPADLHGLVLRGGMADLLQDHIRSVTRHLPALNQADAPAVARATLAMVAASIRSSAESLAAPDPDFALLSRARKLIESRLADPALTPDAICAALRISRSRLYALFQRFGGVAAHIQDRRLARIHAILVQGRDPRPLSAIALAHGFTNPAHFSRAFRERYDQTPRDVRLGLAAGPAAMGAAGPGSLLDWLNALATRSSPLGAIRDLDAE